MSRLLLSGCAALAWLLFFSSTPAPGADTKATNDGRELHVVSIYQGVTRTGNEIHGGRARVTVDRPGAKVTLACAAYERVTWEIALTPDTKLEKVILGGYYPQAVKGVGEEVEVVKAFRNDSNDGSPLLRYCYVMDSAEFRSFLHELAKLCNLPVASFQGTYAYKHESPFVVKEIQDDPRLSLDYPTPTPLADLPDLTFRAVHIAGGDRFPHRVDASYGDFTLAGPIVDTLQSLPQGVSRVAFDSAGKQYYGVAGHSVVTWKEGEKKATPMDLGFDVPQLHWPADVAIDAKRRRLLLVSSGYLYAYDIATEKWSALAERPELTALTYNSNLDAVFGIALQHGEHGDRPVLRQLNTEGTVVKSTPLGSPIIPGTFGRGPGIGEVRLAPGDDYVIALVSPNGRFGGESPGPRTSCIYLIDPKEGKVWLTAKETLPDAKEKE